MVKFTKVYFLLITVAFISIISKGFGQFNIDSLESAIRYSKHDTTKAKRILDLSWQLKDNDISKSIDLANQSLYISLKENYHFGISKSYILLGVYHTIQGNFSEAKDNYLKCMEIRNKQGDSLGVAAVINNLGINDLYQGNFTSALNYFLESIRMMEKNNGLPQTIGETYVNVGDIYMGMKNYEKALEYYLHYMKVNEGLGDERSIPEVYGNIGNAYLSLNNPTEAKKYFDEGLAISQSLSNRNTEAVCLAGLSSILANSQQYTEAIALIKTAAALNELTNNREALTNSLNQLGSYYNLLQKYDSAIAVLYKSISISRKLGMKTNILNAYKIIAESYEAIKDFENAFASMRYYNLYTDSVLNENNNRMVAEMEAAFQNDKKTKENELLSQDNKIQELTIKKRNTLLITVLAALAILILLFLLYFNRKKHEKKIAEQQAVILQDRIRMESVINTQEQERTRISSELHDGLGQLLSAARMNISLLGENGNNNHASNALLEKSLNLIDQSCKELRNISHNLMPALLTNKGLIPATREMIDYFSGTSGMAIHFDTEVDNLNIEKKTEIHLFRILQELLTNSINHSNATEIQISINVNDQLELMVEDNGKGFDKAQLELSNGNGWHNIQSRMKAINGFLEVDSKPGKGTVTRIEVPINQSTTTTTEFYL